MATTTTEAVVDSTATATTEAAVDLTATTTTEAVVGSEVNCKEEWQKCRSAEREKIGQ